MNIYNNTQFVDDLNLALGDIIRHNGKIYSISTLRDILFSMFNGSGLDFEFDDKTGDFNIPIIGKLFIYGEFESNPYQCHNYYCISVVIKQDDKQQYVEFLTRISPEAVKSHLPLFKEVIRTVLSVAEPLLETMNQKPDVLAIVKDKVNAAGISDVKIIPALERDYKTYVYVPVKDEYTMFKEIIPGIRIAINFNAENYGERCRRFIQTVEKIPQIFSSPVFRQSRAVHYSPICEIPSDAPTRYNWNDVNEHMKYVDMTLKSTACYDIPSELKSIVLKLQDLGFNYSIEGKILIVVINKQISLCRSKKKTWFLTKEKQSNILNIDSDDFILALRIIARASSVNGFSISKKAMSLFLINPKFYNILIPALTEYLPIEAYWKIEPYEWGIKYGVGFKFDVDKGNSLQLIWQIMCNLDSIEALYDINRHGKNYARIESLMGYDREHDDYGRWWQI